jgi:predicted signal transduction protein with EAL and GGDEF domain
MHASPKSCPADRVEDAGELRQWRALVADRDRLLAELRSAREDMFVWTSVFEQAEARVRHLAEYDSLTELPNRTLLLRPLRGMLHAAKVSGQKVAEGVETREQLAALRAHHCDQIQGLLASPPLPADGFLRFLNEWQGFAD